MILTITGKDSLTLNIAGEAVVISDLSFGDGSKIEFPNELSVIKTGKDGNSVIALNNSGINSKLTLRLPIGSPSDKKLQSALSLWLSSPTTFTAISGTFIKKAGDGLGNEISPTYTLLGGVPLKVPGASYNSDGDSEQGVSTWEMIFCSAARSIA